MTTNKKVFEKIDSLISYVQFHIPLMKEYKQEVIKRLEEIEEELIK